MPRSSGRLRAEGLHTHIQPSSADSRCHDTTLARSGVLAPTVPELPSPAGPLILAGWTPSLLPAGGFPPGRHTTQSASLCFGQLQWTNSSTKVPLHSHVCVYACPAPGMLCEWRTRMPHAARRILQALHPPLAYAGSILIKVIFSLLGWVLGGGLSVATRYLWPPVFTQDLCDESVADDNRRCQMPSGKCQYGRDKPQGYLAGKGTRCVGSKVVNGFPHFNAKDDRSRGTPLRQLHLCRFTGLDTEFHDLCQHCETLGLCYLREPEEAGLASLS